MVTKGCVPPMSRRGLSRPPGCGCDPWVTVDKMGNVMELRTCPKCVEKALDSLRGICYSTHVVKGGDSVVEYQRDLFVEPSGSAVTPIPLEKNDGA